MEGWEESGRKGRETRERWKGVGGKEREEEKQKTARNAY